MSNGALYLSIVSNKDNFYIHKIRKKRPNTERTFWLCILMLLNLCVFCNCIAWKMCHRVCEQHKFHAQSECRSLINILLSSAFNAIRWLSFTCCIFLQFHLFWILPSWNGCEKLKIPVYFPFFLAVFRLNGFAYATSLNYGIYTIYSTNNCECIRKMVQRTTINK